MPLILESTLTRTFVSRCDKTPEAIAFASRRDGTWVQTTYGELLVRVLAIAAHFKKLGVTPGQNVAIVSDTSEEMVVSQWALWTLGAVVVPLSLSSLLSFRLPPPSLQAYSSSSRLAAFPFRPSKKKFCSQFSPGLCSLGPCNFGNDSLTLTK